MPIYGELGFPNITAASWVGFFAPAKTDPQILETLNLAINQVITSPDIQTRLISLGFDPIAGSQVEADKMFNALAQGGQVQMPLTKTFFSPKFGMCADKFGVGWMVMVAQ